MDRLGCFCTCAASSTADSTDLQLQLRHVQLAYGLSQAASNYK